MNPLAQMSIPLQLPEEPMETFTPSGGIGQLGRETDLDNMYRASELEYMKRYMGALGGGIDMNRVTHVPEDRFKDYNDQPARVLGQYDPNTDQIETYNKGDFRTVRSHEFQHRDLGKYGLSEEGNQLLDLYLARQIDPAEDVISSKISESMGILEDLLTMEQTKPELNLFEKLTTPNDPMNMDIASVVKGISRAGAELMQEEMPLRKRWLEWNSQRSQ